MAILVDLVKHAIRAESHADTEHKNENVVAVHRLYAPAEIDGKIYRVKITVKDYVLNDGREKNNLYAIEAAEIENAPMGTLPASAQTQKQVQPTSGRDLSIADLMRGASQHHGEPFSGSLKFSRKAKADDEYQRDLIVTHNLTAQNILHTQKMGGLPYASLVISKKDQALSGFGEITLIGRKDDIDPEGLHKAKVFGSDIFSPRFEMKISPLYQLECRWRLRLFCLCAI